MDADPAAAKYINKLEHTSSNEQATKLPLLFEKILDPDQEPRFTFSYVAAIRRVLFRERKGVETPGFSGRRFSRFGQAALDAGLVPTMKSVIATTAQDNYSVLAIYYGIDALTQLSETGTLEQKRALGKQILEHGVLTVVYDRLENYPYFIVRIIAGNLLAILARGSDYFVTQPDLAVVAEMIFRCSQACLVGPDKAVEEMNDPSRRWTTRYFWEGQRRMTVLEAVKYAPRRYGMLQENVFIGVMQIAAPLPVRKKTAVLEMVRKRPEILDQTLAIASETRPPWYPETEVYCIAAECFASLVNLPMDRVPGVPVSLEGDLQRETDEEWAATLDILRMVTAAPGWVNKVYAMWDRVESEPWMVIEVLLNRIIDHHNVKDPNALHDISEQKGTSRISVLRAVISLTYLPDSLPDFFILVFLRVAYACSQKAPQLDDIPDSVEGLDTLLLFAERTQAVFRQPILVELENLDTPDYSSVLYGEEFVGPIAFLRLLLLLSERGLLSEISSWSAIPPCDNDGVRPGMKNPSLSQLKQITSPAVVRKFVSMSLRRVKELREVRGRRQVEDGKFHDARWSYACGSELSAAVVAFLEGTGASTELKSKFSDEAKKELVLCLGNAAEVSIRGKRRLEGLKFASAAVAIGATCANITEAIATKNRNRYEAALNAAE